MLKTQQLVVVDIDLAGRLANEVTALQDVADQLTGSGVLGAGRAGVQLTHLANVVQDCTRKNQALVEGRCHLGIVVGVAVGKEYCIPCHAEHVFEQSTNERVVMTLGREAASNVSRY